MSLIGIQTILRYPFPGSLQDDENELLRFSVYVSWVPSWDSRWVVPASFHPALARL